LIALIFNRKNLAWFAEAKLQEFHIIKLYFYKKTQTVKYFLSLKNFSYTKHYNKYIFIEHKNAEKLFKKHELINSSKQNAKVV